MNASMQFPAEVPKESLPFLTALLDNIGDNMNEETLTYALITSSIWNPGDPARDPLGAVERAFLNGSMREPLAVLSGPGELLRVFTSARRN